MKTFARKRHPDSTTPGAWRVVPGGVTCASGFLAAGVAAGIKKNGPDLAVVFSAHPSVGAAVFTRNHVKAAPVLVSQEQLRRAKGRVRAILLNSGCANACTGARGMRDALRSARALASRLKIPTEQVLVASTGVIGTPLPIRRLLKGLPAAVSCLSADGSVDAVRAIMTTDTREKTAAVEAHRDGKIARIGGMVKGAGMIHPQMATMLAVITTDVAVGRTTLERIFRAVVERTFNCLTVDGDTSTNDMVLLMANGASRLRLDRHSASFFEEGLHAVCENLAKNVARDGEGATKFVEITVRGAPDFDRARTVAKAIANSPLVKTALYGQELNWGRVLAAAGNSGVPFDPSRVTLKVSGITVYRRGRGVTGNRGIAEECLKARDLQILLDLGTDGAAARVWTCDLSHAYVDINGSYIS